jgi:O-antigen ligase
VTDRRTIVSKNLLFTALSMAVVALPFSVTLCHASFVFLIVLWIIEGRWAEKLSVVKKSFLLKVLLIFTLWLVIGLLYTSNMKEGMFALERKLFFFLVPLVLATTTIKLDETDIRRIFYLFVMACLAGTLVCLGYAVWQINLHTPTVPDPSISYLHGSKFDTLHPIPEYTWLFFSYTALSEGIAIHPAYFSMYLAFCIFFLLHDVLSVQLTRVHKVLISVAILLFSVVIILLSSRIIIISLITVYLLVAGYRLAIRRSLTTSLTIIALMLVALALLFVNPVSRYRNLQEFGMSSLEIREKSLYKTSTEIRASLWWLALKAYGRTNPLLGSGSGDVIGLMKQTSDAYEITNVMDTHDPHCQYLYLLIGNGIPGLLIFCLYLIFPLICAWTVRDYLFLAFSFLFAALCLTESALEVQKGIAFFSVFQSLLVFQRRSFQSEVFKLKLFSAGS